MAVGESGSSNDQREPRPGFSGGTYLKMTVQMFNLELKKIFFVNSRGMDGPKKTTQCESRLLPSLDK